MRTISVFGSTGSIGKNTIEIIKSYPEIFKVKILTAKSNFKELARQALELQPEYVYIDDKTKEAELEFLLKNSAINIFKGKIDELASIKVDLCVMAIMGHYAIIPTIKAIEAGNNIALANKECLVCAGKMIMNLAAKHKIQIIPIDSEHSGLFQIFDFKQPNLIKDITLTASGGPFREFSLEAMRNVTKAQALKHPNWEMGSKITIDSATLVNKCLEVIEAYYLFPLKAEQIKILIHPESIIHAILNFTDGSILTQASLPNMQIPISYALFYPDRANLKEYNNFDFTQKTSLNFFAPDKKRFRALALLDEVLKEEKNNASLVFNIANEVAVAKFLNDEIEFYRIVEFIEKALNEITVPVSEDIDQLLYSIDYIKNKLTQIP